MGRLKGSYPVSWFLMAMIGVIMAIIFGVVVLGLGKMFTPFFGG